MKRILNNIISSHYLSIVVSLVFLAVNVFEFYYLKNSIFEKIDNINIKSFNEESIVKEDNIIEEDNDLIYVDIKGEVKSPGVYEVNSGSRVSDVIKLSGGLTKNANTRFINLSKILKDGEVIVIYSNNEINNATKTKTETIYVNTPCVCEEVKNDACLIENLNIEEPINETKDNKININTATKEELMSLSGIGESKANSIIEYRNNNGLFNSIEDIINVSGISETIFSKIKESITV